jgi:hypothetical protein
VPAPSVGLLLLLGQNLGQSERLKRRGKAG